MRDDYRLLPAPRELQRRGNRVVTAIMLAIGLVLAVLIGTVEGIRFNAVTWIVLVLIAAVLGAIAKLTYDRLSPDEREVLRRASHRVLEPLPLSDSVDIALSPPTKRQQRRATSELPPVIAVTSEALVVPGWLLYGPPRKVAADELVRFPWGDITRFRVCNDSDGPDLYHVTVKADGRDPEWRIRRHEITDEVALLDAVRGVGQLTIDLEADVARPPLRGRE